MSRFLVLKNKKPHFENVYSLLSKAIFNLFRILFIIHYSVVRLSLLKFKDPIHFASPNHLGFALIVMHKYI